MFALDTNAVSEMTRPVPDAGVVEWLQATPRSALFLPAIVIAELYAGIEFLPAGRRRDSLVGLIGTFIDQTPAGNILAFGLSEAVHYAAIVSLRRKQGRAMKELDAQIAATTAANRLAIVTRNVRDFEGCGIEIINPWMGAA